MWKKLSNRNYLVCVDGEAHRLDTLRSGVENSRLEFFFCVLLLLFTALNAAWECALNSRQQAAIAL